ncbi:MAG: hypothetical protein EXS25_09915 [Pedosphaera sp.]|nr:hypothetical protein [Pedosphaera sp.]
MNPLSKTPPSNASRNWAMRSGTGRISRPVKSAAERDSFGEWGAIGALARGRPATEPVHVVLRSSPPQMARC